MKAHNFITVNRSFLKKREEFLLDFEKPRGYTAQSFLRNIVEQGYYTLISGRINRSRVKPLISLAIAAVFLFAGCSGEDPPAEIIYPVYTGISPDDVEQSKLPEPGEAQRTEENAEEEAIVTEQDTYGKPARPAGASGEIETASIPEDVYATGEGAAKEPELQHTLSGKGREISGKLNSNGMFSLWKVEESTGNYFYLRNIRDEFRRYLSPAVNSYYLFDEDNAYKILRFDSGDAFYLNTDYTALYSYNKSTNEMLMAGIENGGFFPDGERAVFSYFDMIDGIWYCQLLSKKQSLAGEFREIDNDEFKIRMWNYYTKEELSLGDGFSEGAIDVVVKYTGEKEISEKSPVVVLLKESGEQGFYPVAGSAVTSKSDAGVLLTGIPDGAYNLFVIRINDILKSADPLPGDSYTIYDGTWYRGPEPVDIEIRNGSYHNLLVSFDDTYMLPESIMGEKLCDLKAVEYSLEGNILTVSIDIDTAKFEENPVASAFLIAPSSCKYNRSGFDRGQKLAVDLERKDRSDLWEGSIILADYLEKGEWKLGVIEIEGVSGGAPRLAGFSMISDERIQDVFWYYDWTYEPAMVKIKTGIKVPSVALSPGEPDISAPRLVALDAVEGEGKTVEFFVTVENEGSLGHGVESSPVQITLYHEDDTSMTAEGACIIYSVDPPVIEGAHATYGLALNLNDLPEYGRWDVKSVRLSDYAGNSSYYFIYDDEIYSNIYNFWGNDGTYCFYGFGPELPVMTGIEMLSVIKYEEPDIYIAGYYNADSKFSRFPDDERVPCLWKNGKMDEPALSYKPFASPESLYVSGESVYMAGYTYSEADPQARGDIKDAVACLWKDGTMRILDESRYGRASSIFVKDGIIYAAGYYKDDTGRYNACLWIDGGHSVSRTDVITGSIRDNYPTQAVSVFPSLDGDIHIVGNYTDGSEMTACWWRLDNKGAIIEEKKLKVEGFNDVLAGSLFITESDVYITSGYRNHELLKTAAALWINGEMDIIHEGDNARAGSIYVSEKTAYICGSMTDSSGRQIACLWEAGESGTVRYDFDAPGDASACSIHSDGRDLYAAGSYETTAEGRPEQTACFWKNGTRTDLTGYKGHNAGATVVFVVE